MLTTNIADDDGQHEKGQTDHNDAKNLHPSWCACGRSGVGLGHDGLPIVYGDLEEVWDLENLVNEHDDGHVQ
jgi:hypothetical protein